MLFENRSELAKVRIDFRSELTKVQTKVRSKFTQVRIELKSELTKMFKDFFIVLNNYSNILYHYL